MAAIEEYDDDHPFAGIDEVPEVLDPRRQDTATPAPVTSALATSALATSALATSVPVTPVPAPVTSALATSVPVTSVPALATSALATSVPVTPVPAPVTSAPVTSAPVTSAPVTSAPVTSAPVTSAPVTSAPVTSAPAPDYMDIVVTILQKPEFVMWIAIRVVGEITGRLAISLIADILVFGLLIKFHSVQIDVVNGEAKKVIGTIVDATVPTLTFSAATTADEAVTGAPALKTTALIPSPAKNQLTPVASSTSPLASTASLLSSAGAKKPVDLSKLPPAYLRFFNNSSGDKAIRLYKWLEDGNDAGGYTTIEEIEAVASSLCCA